MTASSCPILVNTKRQILYLHVHCLGKALKKRQSDHKYTLTSRQGVDEFYGLFLLFSASFTGHSWIFSKHAWFDSDEARETILRTAPRLQVAVTVAVKRHFTNEFLVFLQAAFTLFSWYDYVRFYK